MELLARSVLLVSFMAIASKLKVFNLYLRYLPRVEGTKVPTFEVGTFVGTLDHYST